MGAPAPPVTGAPVPRKEDRRLLTGSSSFADDLHRPGMAHAAIVRSPHAHARIVAIDARAALAGPGAVGVVTSADLPAELAPIPMRMYALPGMERFLQSPLAREVVRYSGEPVAVVLAESRYLAEDLAELVAVEYEPLAPVLDGPGALAAGSSILHESAGTNVAATIAIEHGDVDAAFREADVVVEERIACHRHAAVPLETRGLVAELEAATGRLTVWGAAKVVHVNRSILARLLGWPEERIRLVELDVGGGFGARGEFYPEDFLIPWCAIAYGRPVAWNEDRQENLRSTNHSREQLHEIAIALGADGTFLGLRDHVIHDTGAYVRTHGSVVPGLTAALLPGPYRWPAYRCTVEQVVTSKTPAGTYRSPGRYEANLARERAIDLAAHRLGCDALELRRRNLIGPDEMPYETGTAAEGHALVYDSGDYPLLVRKASDAPWYEEMRAWRHADPGPGRRRGFGVALFVEKSGIGRWEYARVALAPEGTAVVHTGSASIGQGVETVLAQICADQLGVPYESVRVEHGDTAVVPRGMGSFGSRATMLAGSAVMRAAGELRRHTLELAGEVLEAAPGDLELVDGRVAVRGSPAASVPLGELLAEAEPLSALRRGRSPGLAEEAYFVSEHMSFPYGLHCAAVEVDLETGGVAVARYGVAFDVGRAINPMLVAGQLVGGVAQGVGGALLEELAYDAGGQLAAGTFMDYLLPTAAETPPVEVLITEDAPTPLSPLGAKGAGEGGVTAGGAVLANAVSDALGAEATTLPLTPERVLDLACEGGAVHDPIRGER